MLKRRLSLLLQNLRPRRHASKGKRQKAPREQWYRFDLGGKLGVHRRAGSRSMPHLSIIDTSRWSAGYD